MRVALALFAASAFLAAQTAPKRYAAPKVWDDAALAEWATPIPGINARPGHFSAKEYYAAPLDNYRAYPVYHPDREPAGYWEALQKKRPEPLIETGKLRTKAEWIAEGKRVWQEFDVPIFRLYDAESISLARSREFIDKSGTFVERDGKLAAYRWIVTPKGVALTLVECASCHSHYMDDGTPLPGAGFNRPVTGPIDRMIAEFNRAAFPGDSFPQMLYRQFAVPWLAGDIHEKIKAMSEAEITAMFAAQIPGVIDRFNGSTFFLTKVPDLIGVSERRYLDHSATHRHRGIGDLMRYAAMVSYADSLDFGQHRMLTDAQRVIPYRVPDDALYALSEYIYTLRPPPNPHRFDETAARGKRVFEKSGCAACHTPPAYTNNKLTLAAGFQLPDHHPYQPDVMPISVGMDSALALKTRKGTGLYKIPSLKGVWYRGLYGHDGAIASLDEWFNPARLQDDYVPGGFKGYQVERRAIKGHEFGLDLSPTDKQALIVFLKTL